MYSFVLVIIKSKYYSKYICVSILQIFHFFFMQEEQNSPCGKFLCSWQNEREKLESYIEDDVLTALRIECVESLKLFSRLQIGDSVIHSKLYERVSRRNSSTVAYKKECSIKYGQIECFFKVPEESTIQFGAVICPMAVSSVVQGT